MKSFKVATMFDDASNLGAGKTSTVHYLATVGDAIAHCIITAVLPRLRVNSSPSFLQLMGRPCFDVVCNAELKMNILERYITGCLFTGHWLLFENVQKLTPG